MAEGGSVSEPLARSGTPFDFICESCHKDGSNVKAEVYCEDCKEYLCSVCLDAHKRTKTTKRHRLLGKKTMPKDKSLSVDRTRSAISINSSDFPCEPVSFYFENKSFDKRFAMSQNPTTGTISIPEKRKLDSKDFKEFIKKLSHLRKWSKELEEKARSKLTHINVHGCVEPFNGEKEKKMVEILDTCNDVTDKVEKIQAEIDKLEASQKHLKLIVLIMDGRKQLSRLEAKLQLAEQSLYKRAPKVKSDRMDKGPGIYGTKRGEQGCRNETDQETDVKPVTRRGENKSRKQSVEESAKQISMYKSEAHTQANFAAQRSEKNSHTQAQPHSETQAVVEAIFFFDINVKRRYEKCMCYITGCVVMDKDKLVITDYSNNAVKLVDTASGKLVRRLSISGSPWDVAVIGKDEIVVTLVEEQRLLLISVAGNTLTKEREIPVSGECRGVAKLDNRLLVTFWYPPRLEMLDMNGEVINKLENGIDGNSLFHRPGYLCVSQDGKTIYVSNRGCHTIARLTKYGEVLSTYGHKELEHPQKVCVDNQGRVYVCGKSSRNVHLLTADLEPIQIIKLPVEVRTFCPCMETNRLYVGMQDNSFVKVFDLPGLNPGQTESSFVNTVYTRTKLE